MSNESSKHNSHEIGAEEAKVAELLGTLRRVEAPKDFDFRLKAKIARGRPAEPPQVRFIPALKYVAPLALLLLIGSFVMFSGVYSTGDGPAVANDTALEPEVTTGRENPTTQPEPVTTEPPVQPTINVPVRVAKNQVASSIPRRNVEQSRSSRESRKSGSYQIGLGETRRVINDPNKDANSNGRVPIRNVEVGTADVGEVFKMWEVETEKVANGWRVKSASPNGVGGRSGIKSGDVIESVGGGPLDGATIIKGKTVTVVRDGKRINIDLKN